jgi:DNA-binding transcriptional MerR regulator
MLRYYEKIDEIKKKIQFENDYRTFNDFLTDVPPMNLTIQRKLINLLIKKKLDEKLIDLYYKNQSHEEKKVKPDQKKIFVYFFVYLFKNNFSEKYQKRNEEELESLKELLHSETDIDKNVKLLAMFEYFLNTFSPDKHWEFINKVKEINGNAVDNDIELRRFEIAYYQRNLKECKIIYESIKENLPNLEHLQDFEKFEVSYI